MAVEKKPWSKSELKEIAHLRKEGQSESYIYGFMKAGNNRRGIAPRLEESEMATKKVGKKKVSQKDRLKGSKKKVAKKGTTKKKAAGKKAAGKPGRKAGGFQVGDTLEAVQGMDDKFYKNFPRFKAYQLLCKKKKMKTSAFVDAVEKLEGVKSRGQALGILTKLLDKQCAKASGKVAKA